MQHLASLRVPRNRARRVSKKIFLKMEKGGRISLHQVLPRTENDRRTGIPDQPCGVVAGEIEGLFLDVNQVPPLPPDHFADSLVVKSVVRKAAQPPRSKPDTSLQQLIGFGGIRLEVLVLPTMRRYHRQPHPQPGQFPKPCPLRSSDHRSRYHQYFHAASAVSAARFHNTEPASRQPRLKSRSATTLSSSKARL